MVDIANPAYFEKLVEPFHNTPFIIGTNQTHYCKIPYVPRLYASSLCMLFKITF